MVGVNKSVNSFNKNIFHDFCIRHGLIFPQTYIDLLTEYNDSDLEPNIIYLSDNECTVRYFFGTGGTRYSDIEEVYKTFISRLPEKCIPIAELDCGNLICISLCDENYGKIYFWDHETMDTPAGQDSLLRFENMELIADSFDGLCAKIQASPYTDAIETYTPWQIKWNRFVSWLRTLWSRF